MNPWLLGLLIWCAVGALFTLWYWHEKERTILHKKVLMSVVELLLGPILWPLGAISAWIWRRSRMERLQEFYRTGTPHCRKHGYILLKCENSHEAFCSGCSPTVCPRCGQDAFLSPRYHGRSAANEPIIVYERIHAPKK